MATFRESLRRFLADHHPGIPPRDRDERWAWQRRWAAHLVDEGWAGPSWPRRYGGMELSLDDQVAYHEEYAAAGVPRHPGVNLGTVGPTIILHGTDAQRERFLRPMLRADELWAQGFSEPDAGSDLRSLTTRAPRDGDDYVVSGHKVWSSDADRSHWLFALVRTGPPDGITYLLVDLESPGIEVRPLRDMTGSSGFCEVVLDRVRVPIANRVGEDGEGWRIARTSLGHERSAASVARAYSYRRTVDELHALARRLGRARDPVMRQRLADAEIGVRLLALNARRVLATVSAGGEPGPASSASRLFHALFEQRLHELAVDLTGADALLSARDPAAVDGGRWTWGFLRTRASTIGAGTAEVQRNTLAERVLGLPSEPAVGN